MKTVPALIAFASLATLVSLTGCSSPSARHDARVDRRYDAVERSDTRVSNRQDNRYDRRSDRGDRVDARYGY